MGTSHEKIQFRVQESKFYCQQDLGLNPCSCFTLSELKQMSGLWILSCDGQNDSGAAGRKTETDTYIEPLLELGKCSISINYCQCYQLHHPASSTDTWPTFSLKQRGKLNWQNSTCDLHNLSLRGYFGRKGNKVLHYTSHVKCSEVPAQLSVISIHGKVSSSFLQPLLPSSNQIRALATVTLMTKPNGKRAVIHYPCTSP